MILRLDTPYYPIPGSEPESTFGAIVEILLKARIKLQLETSQERYGEEVNTYLAGLLVSYIDPDYLTAISEAVSKYDVDVHQAVSQSQDNVQAYWIYKVNADDLLLSLGIFQRLWREAQGEVGKLKRYYSCASEYRHRIYGKSTSVGEIHSELSEETERYLTILSGVRRDYMHFVEHLKSEDLSDFRQALEQFEQELPIKAKRDEFLDAYSAWANSPNDNELRNRLLRILEELKKLDPQFQADSILSKLTSL